MYQICQSFPLWLQRNVTGIGSAEPAAKQLVIRSGGALPLLYFLMPLSVYPLMLNHVLKEIGRWEMKSFLEKNWTPLCDGFMAKSGRRTGSSTRNGFKACTGEHFPLARIFSMQAGLSELKYKRIKVSAWNPALAMQYDTGNWQYKCKWFHEQWEK